MSNPLSPAAQAVIDAVVAASPRLQERGIRNTRSPLIAAALRAAVEQISRLMPNSPTNDAFDGGYVTGMARAIDELTAIATDLEGTA